MAHDIPVYYSPDYTLAGYAFDTTRKAALVAASLNEEPVKGVQMVEPEPLTEAQLSEVHDAAYVSAVRTGEPRDLAQSQGFDWDPGLWQMVCATNGGAVAAALTALAAGGAAGSLSSGLHHAKHDHGDGFCTFNGLALAARAALRAGAGRILIIDLDAHCGGGTAELLGDDPRIHQLDVAVDAYDWYDAPQGWTLDLVADAADYMPTLARRLRELQTAGESFDLVLYNAGMDPFEECRYGRSGWHDRQGPPPARPLRLRLVPLAGEGAGGVRPGRRLCDRRGRPSGAYRAASVDRRVRRRHLCLGYSSGLVQDVQTLRPAGRADQGRLWLSDARDIRGSPARRVRPGWLRHRRRRPEMGVPRVWRSDVVSVSR